MTDHVIHGAQLPKGEFDQPRLGTNCDVIVGVPEKNMEPHGGEAPLFRLKSVNSEGAHGRVGRRLP